MHKDEDLDRKVLSVIIFFFWNRISLDLNYSRLAGTLLTVINEIFFSEGQRVCLRYSSDYAIQPGKSIMYK